MALVRMNFESQFLRNNHEISIILPDRPRDQEPREFYGSAKYPVLWLLHGTFGDHIAAGDNDTTVTDGPRRLAATLARRGIEHTFNETTGGHTWINWRKYLRDFAQLLFRD